MQKIDWLLIAEIASGLDLMVKLHDWDLSDGEWASLAESFYESLRGGFPSSKKEVRACFERAYVATWGDDHTCDPVSDAEMLSFMVCLSYYYRSSKVNEKLDYSVYLRKNLCLEQSILEAQKYPIG